jgi:hypothetical protein
MKKLFVLFAGLCLAVVVQAQSNPIEDMFNKYSEKEGFTVVTISGKMFSMFAGQESGNSAEGNVMSQLKSIRILSVEDSLLNKSINFYTELSKKIDFSVYEELMVVKEGQDMTKFLIRQNGNRITELLVLVGGPSGNSLISIQGDLDLKSISDLSKNMGIEDLEKLEGIDGKEGQGEKKK